MAGLWSLLVLLVATALVTTLPTHAAPPAPVRPADARGTTVVPDDFLRRFDPITVFFERDRGPVEGGPVADPSSVVALEPAHPVAVDWLDARTLRIRPVDPWPALERFDLRVDGERFTLQTLLAPPVETDPVMGAEGVEEPRSITLAFAEPLDADDLARALTVTLRPLPGVGEGEERRLDEDDFAVKVLERARRDEPARYVLDLARPLPRGQRVTVAMRLSLTSVAGRPSGEVPVLRFATAEPFRPVSFGCATAQLPVTPSGSRYPEEQAVRCDDDQPSARVVFSAALPGEIDPLAARNLVRLSPSVTNLEVRSAGDSLWVTGDFARDTPYRLALRALPSAGPGAGSDAGSGAFPDARGRALDVSAESSMWLYFPARPAFLQFTAGHGLVERLGPKTVPVEGRGEERVDLRIHRVDPLDLDLWPFPDGPVWTDETERPPGPGEEPAGHDDLWRVPRADELAERLRALGSPTVSTLVDLPLGPKRPGARFGLDLGPTLDRAFGADAPGAYLVGLRRLDGSPGRTWMRIESTDLSLTTFEEPRRVVFAVTSLETGQPVAGARVRVEGAVRGGPQGGSQNRWEDFFSGTTDADGRVAWSLGEGSLGEGGSSGRRNPWVRRIVVEKDGDRLVLDSTRPPERYFGGAFVEDYENWLQWTQNLGDSNEEPTRLAHVFTERPVYRPEEPVHLVAYARERLRGRLEPLVRDARFVITGPGGREWRLDADLDAEGIAYALFEAGEGTAETPSGVYRARFEVSVPGSAPDSAPDSANEILGDVTFKKEAYRLPRFEVLLDGPEGPGVVDSRATLDAPFRVDLVATYYAGGRVARRPVRWRVTQFPHVVEPRARDGFVYSSDGRFSRTERFESTPALERETLTDDDGGAVLEIDPSIEPTAQPRVYVVEATVTGVDDQAVTATRRVVALPPFLLGLDAPRFLEPGEELAPRVLVLGPDDEPLAGREVTVRLLHRQWHSHLRASDFSDGVGRYVTDVVDEAIFETTVTSTGGPLEVPLPVGEPGVYVVELEARDRLGRAQVVAVDLYAAGGQESPIAWERPKDQTFEISTDRASYAPGETARLVLRSPFQEARAMVVVETPDGNRYRWVDVRGGEAVFELSVEGHWAPRLPVHAVLMRGRVPGTAPRPGNAADLGKPATLVATRWVDVDPRALRVEVGLEHPSEAMPGRTIAVDVTLATPDGRPASGTVALWLVDRAVLALGREQRLDPVLDFLPSPESRLTIHDTRGLVFGDLPLVELPGGGEGAEERGVLDRQTVRENFEPVPFFAPRIRVGADGRATVEITLPDNLTDFAVRAKAVSGPMRFGFAASRLSVRLPVIVQPALPRFLRPGDEFTAAAIARVVSGSGGPGRFEARVEGVEALGETAGSIELPGSDSGSGDPLRVELPVRAPLGAGAEASGEAKFTFGIERSSDGAGDAFAVTLPIVDDRRLVVRREIVEIGPDAPYLWPALDVDVRPGTLERSILLSDRPGPIRLAAGLDALLEYPFGCTEQRISRARARVALRRFRDVLDLDAMEDLERSIAETIAYVRESTRDDGLVPYWPGGRGYVSLTAWTAQFLAEAREAGFAVDPAVVAPLERALERALRSDYSGFVDGAAWTERVMALQALAWLGDFDASYGAELGRKAQFLVSEDLARLVLALERAGEEVEGDGGRPELIDRLWDAVVFRLHQGDEIYAGLRDETERSPLVLPSETRTLAEVVRALARTAPEDPRLEALEAGLVRLGKGDGWGSTQADAAALLALAERLDPALPGSGTAYRVAWNVSWNGEGEASEREVVEGTMTASTAALRPPEGAASDALARGAVEIRADGSLFARVETRFVPSESAAELESLREGFVVERTWLVQDGPRPRRVPIEEPSVLALGVGDVVEEHVRVVAPRDRYFVAVLVPLAAGVEALNPRLATAPPEAVPDGRDTLAPTYVDYRDDHVAFYFDVFPKGAHDFYFRTRASIAGRFVQPPARAEAMYDLSVVGHSAGARVEVERE